MQVNYNDIINNEYKLSPNNYLKVSINSNIYHQLRELVDSVDKGVEIGSNNYVEESEFKFIRTAAISSDKYSIIVDDNSVLDVNPKSFVNFNLKLDDILICKDSNVGEVVKLNKDLPNYMFSSGINKLNINENKDYIFGIMKNHKFKEQLVSMIPKGATLMHAKDLYLNCIIPYPTENSLIDYISSLVRIISNKENELENKMNMINEIIDSEILGNQKDNNYEYSYPKIANIMNINRLDTGIYTKEFCDIDNKLKNYYNGFFYLSKNNVKGGQTPKKRVIEENEKLKYNWITPTYINDDGTLNLNYKINCEKNNINKNCALIINRTSKGGFGEYVGICSFYDYERFGPAQHNQGIYRVFNMNDRDLIYITCLLNSRLYRKYCANTSMGSKMKELKLSNILDIPFPKFSDEKKNQISNYYYNKCQKNDCVAENDFESVNKEWDKNAGVIDLFESIRSAKKYLNYVIDNIYENQTVDKIYKVF